MGTQRKIRVAVVFGGQSPEHPISCASGGTVLASLDRDRYEAVPVGILPDGRWVLTADDPSRLAITGTRLPSVADVALPASDPAPAPEPAARATADPGAAAQAATAAVPGSATSQQPVAGGGVAASQAGGRGGGQPAVPAAQVASAGQVLAGVDIVLPVLHGPFGEDGTIQGLLEMAGVPYVGAGVLASAVSLDKEYMKLVFAARGLPICPYVVVRDRDWQPAAAPGAVPAPSERKRILDTIAELGFPVFVKPARGGSSIGTSRADSAASLVTAIETAREYDTKVIVEKCIEGSEIECGVLESLDGGPPDTSVPGQLVIAGGEEFYDFQAKYLDPSGTMAIPAPIPAAHQAEIRRLAAAAFDAVSCEGFARVDFFYTPDGTILVNEINTIPGLTATSYFPRMWEATGLPMPQLLDRMITTALRKRDTPHRSGGRR